MAKPSLPFAVAIFDLDGVITKTAVVHAAAWKEMFDEYLQMRSRRDGQPFREFTYNGDYLPYVDGKPRYKGVQDFLISRNIHIPFGHPSDPPDEETVCGLGNKKNVKMVEVIETKGVEVYLSTVKLVKDLKKNGVRTGVASSSKNCRAILQSAGLEDLFETRVDGELSAKTGLKGKPEPDIFIVAAKNLGAQPDQAIVVEDAIPGVQAGRNGRFGLVIGIAREDNEKELSENGADVVVKDLAGTDTKRIVQWWNNKNDTSSVS